jgi:hypothetical protein
VIRRRAVLAAASAISLIAAADPLPRSLSADVPTQSEGSKRGDIYLFAGAAGSRQTITVKGSGPLELSVLTPGGEPMNSAKGDGEISLETVLSSTDIHSVIVMREIGSEPYTVTRSVVEATFSEMMLAREVGYASDWGTATFVSCWIEPGKKRRSTSVAPDSTTLVQTDEMRPDRVSYTTLMEGASGKIDSWIVAYHLDGEEFVRSDAVSTGTLVNKYPLAPMLASFGARPGWTSYRCQ